MKNVNLFISLIALFLSLFAIYHSFYHHSDCLYNTNTAIIDSDKIINESLILQKIHHQIKERSSELQQEFDDEIEKIKPLQDEFELLSESAQKEKTDQFNHYATKIKEEYTKKIAYIEQRYRESLDQIFYKLKELAMIEAKKHDLSLVLFISKKNQVLFSAQSVDLSDKILKKINNELQDFALQEK
ncbi:OmpH family outer membrane protein [Wolbachia endosymbiont of Howardula sp.]|uniref:OmpH family outer membrane protein n=1 Tax=Wolbachia endosymbiont of Howardula sp. TaxID=2916816 RepID=UPI00217DE93E|nr:OmpH family outer membrane protein [Wolbachia endosymbiont of Howardula sp.]UWI83248.1 OmpH family outer membrane protein [Wolbachia endosymbiont of Howardula sp.]